MANDNESNPTADSAMEMLLEIAKQATSPDLWEAQNILMRRLALQGDVVASRIPAPRNITEIGGYINFLGKHHQIEMRDQALAGILGVAGPNPPLGWVSNRPMLSMVSISNDRPNGAVQPSIPLSVKIRSDFVAAMQTVLKSVHDLGGFLPLLSLYTPISNEMPQDILSCLGRTLYLFPGSALLDPATDVFTLARPSGSSLEFQIMANVLTAGTIPVVPADWETLKCDWSSCSNVTLNATSLISLGPIFATAGFYQISPLPVPTTNLSNSWARFTNITGLVAGMTKLGDELSNLYSTIDIVNSAFAGNLQWVWNGSMFSQP